MHSENPRLTAEILGAKSVPMPAIPHITQAVAEDRVLMHLYRYHVRMQFIDSLPLEALNEWSVNILNANPPDWHKSESYPAYIREGRRPDVVEREIRDAAIVERWMNAL